MIVNLMLIIRLFRLYIWEIVWLFWGGVIVIKRNSCGIVMLFFCGVEGVGV